MPTRKQRRRQTKERRHEYEFVYVDAEGHELDVDPEELEEAKPREERRNGSKPAAATQKGKQASRGRQPRVPQPPSWQRASKRAGLLGIFVFILFAFTASKSHNGYATALIPAVIYTALFIPFTYAIDRYAYRRYLARQQAGGGAAKAPTKKR